jgi:hypothetical protein
MIKEKLYKEGTKVFEQWKQNKYKDYLSKILNMFVILKSWYDEPFWARETREDMQDRFSNLNYVERSEKQERSFYAAEIKQNKENKEQIQRLLEYKAGEEEKNILAILEKAQERREARRKESWSIQLQMQLSYLLSLVKELDSLVKKFNYIYFRMYRLEYIANRALGEYYGEYWGRYDWLWDKMKIMDDFEEKRLQKVYESIKKK